MPSDLTLPDPEIQEVSVVLAGLAAIQMQALAARDVEKVAAAGNTIGKLAAENPDQVREAFLEEQDGFRVAAMPDEILEHLDLEVRDGKLYRRTDEGDFVEVEIDE